MLLRNYLKNITLFKDYFKTYLIMTLTNNIQRFNDYISNYNQTWLIRFTWNGLFNDSPQNAISIIKFAKETNIFDNIPTFKNVKDFYKYIKKTANEYVSWCKTKDIYTDDECKDLNNFFTGALGEFFFTVFMQNVKTLLIKNINTNKLERFDFDYVCPRLVNEIDYGVDLTGMVSRNNSWYNCAIQVKFWNPFTDNMITNTIVSGVDSDACRNHFINPEDNYNIFICWLGTDKNVSRYLKANKLLYKHLVFIDMDVLNINVNNKLPQFWMILNDNIKNIKNIILNT